MLETAPFDLSQEEKIQIILKNSKNQNDLKILRKLLHQNSKNLEKNRQFSSVSSPADNPVPIPDSPKAHINLSGISALVIWLMMIILKWITGRSDLSVLWCIVIFIGAATIICLSFLLFRATLWGHPPKSIGYNLKTTLLSEAAHLIICIISIFRLFIRYAWGRYFSKYFSGVMPWILLCILCISAITAIVIIVHDIIIRIRTLKNGVYDYPDHINLSAVSAFVIGLMMSLLQLITGQDDLSLLWHIVIFIGTAIIIYLSVRLFLAVYWNSPSKSILCEAVHLALCIVSISGLFIPDVWGYYLYRYYYLSNILLLCALSLSAISAIVTLVRNIIIRKRAYRNGIYDYPDNSNTKEEARKSIAYAIISLNSALYICIIMLMLTICKNFVGWETSAIFGITVIMFLSVLLFCRIYQLKASGTIRASKKTRLIGVFHLCACVFGCLMCLFFYYIYWDLTPILLGTMFISAVGAILTIVQKNKK